MPEKKPKLIPLADCSAQNRSTIRQMRKTSRLSLSYTLALALAICTPAVLADQQAVISSEKRLKKMEALRGQNSTAYFDLACRYLDKNQRNKAFETFEKALEIERIIGYSQDTYMDLYMDWADKLAEHNILHSNPDNMRRAKQAVREAISLCEQVPRCRNFFNKFRVIEFYRDNGFKIEEKNRIKLLDHELSTFERSAPEEYEIYDVSSALEQLAGLYAPAPTFLELQKGIKPTVAVISNPPSGNARTISLEDFSRAECYQLRAGKLLEGLPDNNVVRIKKQRELVFWFRYYGQKAQENYQTQKLSKLLHSSDPKVLFPS